VLELIDGLTKQGRIIGIDLVEVAPDYDHSGTTTILAAQILLNTIGRIAHNRRGKSVDRLQAWLIEASGISPLAGWPRPPRCRSSRCSSSPILARGISPALLHRSSNAP
jgi:hypothetical protein